MKKKSTLTLFLSLLLGSIFVLSTATTSAQITCNNENVLWLEDFGSGTTVSNNPDVVSLVYQPTGSLAAEGTYRVTTNTQQKPEWHASTDHTGNADGKMLVVNGQAETFYRTVITNPHGFADGTYSVSLWIMNVNTPGTCAPNPLLPVMSFTVEYLDASNTWVSLAGSPYVASAIGQSATPVWVNVGSYFNLPPMGTFAPNRIRITIGDGTIGGCGNDFAADDIKFAQCPEGGPTPVTFVDVTAKQKGAGVSIDWSTSQEINNNYFEAERSADGNNGWQSVGRVAGAGNSQVAHQYNAFDANPYSGMNYYRVRQVDKDGKSSYSKTVSLRVDNNGSRVSIIANPFRSTLKVQFSGVSQQVNARLVDLTGKQVARETWNIANGESTQQFTNISSLQKGIYILSVQNKNGEVLFNGKVIKQ